MCMYIKRLAMSGTLCRGGIVMLGIDTRQFQKKGRGDD